jgi:hypothetical protein
LSSSSSKNLLQRWLSLGMGDLWFWLTPILVLAVVASAVRMFASWFGL